MSLIDNVQPMPLPETQTYWDGIDAQTLLIQRCNACKEFYFPAAPVCPKCTSRCVEWIEASGKARLYSYVITQKPWPEWMQAWREDGPMSVALVELAEGPRLVSTIVDCAQTPEALEIDMPLLTTYRRFGTRPSMLCFKPAPMDEGSA